MALNNHQYVTIQGWMGKTGLSLSGPALIIYAIIFGFSQDGVTACRCHLSYFQEWADVCERTARTIINALINADYIHRTILGEGRGALTEYRANLEISSMAQKGAKFAPILKGAKNSEKGAKNSIKGGKICRHDNNSIIIYNNILFPAHGSSPEARRKECIYTLFFFKNATSPQGELDEFMRVNTLNEWKDPRGNRMDDTTERLLAWADGWTLRKGANRVNGIFLNMWRTIYNESTRMGECISKHLINEQIRCVSNSESVTLFVPDDVRQWLEAIISQRGSYIDDVIRKFVRGRQLFYQTISGNA